MKSGPKGLHTEVALIFTAISEKMHLWFPCCDKHHYPKIRVKNSELFSILGLSLKQFNRRLHCSSEHVIIAQVLQTREKQKDGREKMADVVIVMYVHTPYVL